MHAPIPDAQLIRSPLDRYVMASGATSTLEAVVLLAGIVRQAPIDRASRRSRLDLPLRVDRTLGQTWRERVAGLRRTLGRPALRLIVSTNATAGVPAGMESWEHATVQVDREIRGSGGALRDVTESMDPSSHVLIAPGNALPRESLEAVLASMTDCPADVVVQTTPAGAPTGFFRIRCAVLAGVASRGFIDLKEQLLPQLAARFDVRVVSTALAAPLPIRSLDGYIRALRWAAHDGVLEGRDEAEDWEFTFAIAESQAAVHPSARLHDSVVLSGGAVAAQALAVRCLVGPGGTVKAGESCFDQLVGEGVEE
jgi:hypothetical protein